MVELVGHTLVDGAVHFDVDIVADLIGPKVGGEGDVTLLPEGPSKEIPGPRTKTVTSRHFRSLALEEEDMCVTAKTLGERVFSVPFIARGGY